MSKIQVKFSILFSFYFLARELSSFRFVIGDYMFHVLGFATYTPIFVVERAVSIKWASHNI